MADRSVIVRLRAEVDGLKRGFREAGNEVDAFGRRTKASGQQASTAAEDIIRSADRSKQAWTQVGTGFVVAGAAVVGALGLAVSKSIDFEAAMSAAGAATQTQGKAFDALRQAAIDAGAATQYSATESADAITAMGKAGVSAQDILGGGLTGALNLAAAGQLDVADAADIAATALTQFGLAGRDLPHVADLLAAGAGKAQGSVEDLGLALGYVGPVAAGMNISIEETVGVLAEFASKGIIGERAGTSFRGMLASLSSPSQQAQDELDRLGISLYDGTGKFIGMQGAANALQQGLGGLTDQQRDASLGIIFGNQQLTAARILYEGGAKSVAEWTDKVNESGFATEQARRLTDNLRGDIERLGGAFDTALISTGSKANGVLRAMVQEVTGAVDIYNDLPGPLQATGVAVGGVAGAVSLLGGGLLVAAPRIVETKKALDQMGRTGALLKSALSGSASVLSGPWGIALAGGVLALGYWAKKHAEAVQADEEFRTSLDQTTGAITEQSTAMRAQQLQQDGTLDMAKRLGVSYQDVTQAALGNADAIDRIRGIYEGAQAAAADLAGQYQEVTGQSLTAAGSIAVSTSELGRQATAAENTATGIGTLLSRIAPWTERSAEAQEKQRQLAEATAQSGEAATTAAGGLDKGAGAIDGMGGAAEKTSSKVDDLNSALDRLYGRTYSVQEAQDGFYSKLNDLSKAIETNGKKLTGNSDAALTNRGRLRDVADAANDVIGKMVEQGASYDQVVAKTQSLKKAYDDHARKAHITGAAVKEVDDYLDRLPGTYKAVLTADDRASGPAHAAKSALDRVVGNYQATITTRFRTIGQPTPYTRGGGGGAGVVVLPGGGAGVLRKPAKADGGPITGVGGPREDNQLIWASVGEYMVNAASTKKHRALLEAINADRFADGGLVGSPVDRYAAAFFEAARAPRFADSSGAGRASAASQRPVVQKHYHVSGVVNPDIDRLASAVVQRLREQDALSPTYSG